MKILDLCAANEPLGVGVERRNVSREIRVRKDNTVSSVHIKRVEAHVTHARRIIDAGSFFSQAPSFSLSLSSYTFYGLTLHCNLQYVSIHCHFHSPPPLPESTLSPNTK